MGSDDDELSSHFSDEGSDDGFSPEPVVSLSWPALGIGGARVLRIFSI